MALLPDIADKESNKAKGSEQAYTDTEKRDNTEKDYYDSKWLKERFTAQEIELLKKEFGITSDSALKVKVERMSDYDLDVLLNKLKNPGTTAYSGYKEPEKQSDNKPTTTSGGTSSINKEQEFENTFRYNKNLKGITAAEFDLIKASVNGNEKEAKKMVINMPESVLNDIISKQIKANTETLTALTNNRDAQKKLREQYSENEIAQLKRYFNIFDENKLLLKTENMSDYYMDGLLSSLRQPYRRKSDNTYAYSEYSFTNTPTSKENSVLSNSNTANNFSNEEIAMLKAYFKTDSEAQALAMAEKKSDYELDRIFEWQRQKFLRPNAPNIFQGKYGDNYYADDKKYYSESPLTEDDKLIYRNSISQIYYGIDTDKDGIGDLKDDGKPYLPLNIANKGCGIVSTVMELEAFNAFGDEGTYKDHVKEASVFALDGGYKKDSGTDISKFTVDYANSKGLVAQHTNNFDDVMNALANGAVVVASVKAGDDKLFNNEGGHIITITGINDDGTLHVNNPIHKGFDAYMAGKDNFSQKDLLSHNNNGYVIIQRP